MSAQVSLYRGKNSGLRVGGLEGGLDLLVLIWPLVRVVRTRTVQHVAHYVLVVCDDFSAATYKESGDFGCFHRIFGP